MQKILHLTALAAALALAGCYTFDAAKLNPTGDEHVCVENYGWFLFDRFPLVCGDIEDLESCPWVFFRNDVTMDKVQNRFMAYAQATGKTPCDLKYINHDSVLFEIPFSSITVPIPYLLSYREIQLSGVLQ